MQSQKTAGMSARMKGPMNAAMSQPRRQPTTAAQAQLDPNWQRKMGGANRYQPSSTFLPRQGGGQNDRSSGKMSSSVGNTNRRAPANAFDAKAFLRTQQRGEYLHANQNDGQQHQQQQPTQQQRMQQQQRQNVGTNVANFDIQAFKRAAPRLQTNVQEQQQQQPRVQQQVQQQQMQQQQRVPPQQQQMQQRVPPQQQQAQQQPRVQQQPVQQQQPRVQQQQVQQQQPRVQQQAQRQIPRTMPQQQIFQEQAPNVDEDADEDDKLPWQSASENVANRILKGASSKDVLQKIAEMRQTPATEAPAAPNDAAPPAAQPVADEEPARIY